MSHLRLVTLFLCGLLAAAALAEGTTGWRGDGTGSFPGATVPTEWAKDKNVVWTAPLPAWSNATPILVGGNLFLTAEPTTLVCVNAADGKVRWQKAFDYLDTLTPEQATKLRAAMKLSADCQSKAEEIKRDPSKLELYDQLAELCKQVSADKDNAALLRTAQQFKMPETHGENGYTSSTPTTDGTNVFVVNGSGLVTAFDADGNRKWIVFPAKPHHGWGHSASPLFTAGKLLVQLENSVFALDPATGATLWHTECAQEWGSPVAARIGAVDTAVFACGDILRMADGKRLAHLQVGLNYSSPVVQDGVVYFIDGERHSQAYKLPTVAADELTPEKLWDVKITGNRYYASPVIHDGLVYAMNQAGHLTVLDAVTGATVYEKDLDLGQRTTGYPSPVLAGNVIILSSDNGTSVVLQPGKEYKELGHNSLEFFRGSPLCAGTRMYLRARGTLYCIGK